MIIEEVEYVKPEPKPKSPKLKITKVKPPKTESYRPCDMCHEAYLTLGELKEHKLTAHYAELKEKEMIYSDHGKTLIKSHACEYNGCNRYFKGPSSLQDHLDRDHINMRSHVCQECGKGFFMKKELARHVRLRHPGNTGEEHMCNECGDVFPNKPLLTEHMRIKHRPLVKKYNKECRFCDYKTYSKFALTEHERTHTGESPEICKLCGQAFKHKRSLRNHMDQRHPGVDKLLIKPQPIFPTNTLL